MAGIYIHIPFCKQACHYCDFHFSTNTEIRSELVQALVTEMHLQKNYPGQETINTIYLGGGTPSLLTPEELALLFETIHSLFAVADDCEITLEANPDDLSYPYLRMLKQLGVNRLSIGIQTFHDNVLQYLNRSHNSTTAFQSVANARKAGFDNISIDLIYAIPVQSLEAWRRNIIHAVTIAPEHISAYSLTIEKQTVFGRWADKGKIKSESDEAAASQMEILIDELALNNYIQYEVSNFCRPGYESKHNSSYWKQEKYLGIGPSAHSFNGVSRQYNISNNHRYVLAISEQKVPFEFEQLSDADKVNEYLMTGLRTTWGVSLARLKNEYGVDLLTDQKKLVEELLHRKLAVIEKDIFVLTRSGRLLADKISSDLFLVS